jgi:hypothetical protein
MPILCYSQAKTSVDPQPTAVYLRNSEATKVERRFADEDTLVQVAPQPVRPQPAWLTSLTRRLYPRTWLRVAGYVAGCLAGLLLLALVAGPRTGLVVLCVAAIAYFLTAMMYQAIALRPAVSSTTVRQPRARSSEQLSAR